jgi:hypothetical protein
MSLGIFNKKNYQSSTIIKRISRIPSSQANLVCIIGIFLGGPLCLVSLVACLAKTENNDSLLSFVLLMVGMFLFNMALSLPYLVHLSKEIVKIKESLCDECKVKIANED